jgi:hypothetical protein
MTIIYYIHYKLTCSHTAYSHYKLTVIHGHIVPISMAALEKLIFTLHYNFTFDK